MPSGCRQISCSSSPPMRSILNGACVPLRELLGSNTAISGKFNELAGKLKHHDAAITAIL